MKKTKEKTVISFFFHSEIPFYFLFKEEFLGEYEWSKCRVSEGEYSLVAYLRLADPQEVYTAYSLLTSLGFNQSPQV